MNETAETACTVKYPEFDYAQLASYKHRCGQSPSIFADLPEPSEALVAEYEREIDKVIARNPDLVPYLRAYVVSVRTMQLEEIASRNLLPTQAEWVTIEAGPVYVKVVKINRNIDTGVIPGVGGRSPHTFVRIRNTANGKAGDILKAASLKAPAPNGVRGNIMTSDLRHVVNSHGAVYLR